ncbi:MAG: polyprenyl synthetase family protein, partial [Defluviitaleaceae bacterium]|nr:polyprenyl synthetase family protein [Defluviitaleaceae bacterium]
MNDEIDALREKVDLHLYDLLKKCNEKLLREPILYSISAGGKRIRPLLLLTSAQSAGGGCKKIIMDFACAAEMIHTYSLIHDDLPSMDDDELRRGKPTCHVVFGEAKAILAGDALLHFAFEIMTEACIKSNSKRSLYAQYIIAKKTGINGMVAGQTADVHFDGKNICGIILNNIQKRKTGAFFQACVTAGMLLGGGSKEAVRQVYNLGSALGLAFQIRDD